VFRCFRDSTVLARGKYATLIYLIVVLIVFVIVVIVFIVCSVSFIVCVVLFECGLLFCVMCVICLLPLIVVPLAPGKTHLQFK
jgi:hypothetical protein